MQPTPDTHNRDLTWNSSFKFTNSLLNAYYFWVQTASLSGSLWCFLQSRGTSWKREQGEHLIKMTSTSGSLLLARTQVWWHVFGVILMEILTEANLWPNLCLDSHTKAKQAIKCNKNFFNQCPEEKQITQLLTQYCINTPVKFSLVCDMPPSYEEWGEWRLV